MEYTRINWENTTNTPISAENLNRMDEAIYKLTQALHPVGSLYLDTVDRNPSDLFGGTWVEYAQGRALVGAGSYTDTAGTIMDFEPNQSFGFWQATLTEKNLPAHTHNIATAANGVAEAGTIIQRGYQASTSVKQVTTVAAGYTDPTPIDIIQPSVAVYVWLRTA